MSTQSDLDAMTETVITAAEHVNRNGSPELQAAMRVLLYILAGETAEKLKLRPETGSRKHENGNG